MQYDDPHGIKYSMNFALKHNSPDGGKSKQQVVLSPISIELLNRSGCFWREPLIFLLFVKFLVSVMYVIS